MARLPIPGDIFSDPFRGPVLVNRKTGALCYIDDKGNYVPMTAKLPTTPGDQNTYPLHMPGDVKPGAPVTIGVGSDEIKIQISNNPASVPDHGLCSFNVAVDGTVVAVELSVTDSAGMDHGQVFTIKGGWGPLPHKVLLTSSLRANGLHDAWITAITYNGTQLVYNGPSVDARGAKPPPNATSIWNNLGNAVEFSDTKVVVTPEQPAPSQTIISGAFIDGEAVAPGTLADLVPDTPDGGKLKLPAGRFVGAAPVGAITIEGADGGGTVIDATGLLLPGNGKAVLLPLRAGFTASRLKITGASCKDGNGAGVRQMDAGIPFTLRDLEITGCQDGILTFGGVILVERCHIHHNGAGNQGGGDTHEVYVGSTDPASSSATFRQCVVECGALATHAIKSRAGMTIIEGCDLLGNGDNGTHGGAVVDIPQCGKASITDTLITVAPGAGNTQLINWGTDGGNEGFGNELTITGVKFNANGAESGGYIVSRRGGTLNLVGSTYVGSKAPQIIGWDKVTGELTPA